MFLINYSITSSLFHFVPLRPTSVFPNLQDAAERFDRAWRAWQMRESKATRCTAAIRSWFFDMFNINQYQSISNHPQILGFEMFRTLCTNEFWQLVNFRTVKSKAKESGLQKPCAPKKSMLETKWNIQRAEALSQRRNRP